jgi:IS30 family transposase
MHVVPETVYQAVYGSPSKGAPNHAIPGHGHDPGQAHGVIGRLVAGHWEGDLIIGKGGRSAIATLVERTTRFIILVHLGGNRGAENLRDRLADSMSPLPAHLRRFLTCDQGTEMACHESFTRQTLIPVYFCDPASPWQRGSNENTNGLLRQYFPKGTDLGVHSPEHVRRVAAELNRRPLEILGWQSPMEHLARLTSPAIEP